MSKSQKAFIAEIQLHLDRLRETADELKANTIHRVHAANRINLVVDGIARIVVAKVAKEVAKGRKK